jgi:membrane-associated protein
MVLLMVIAAIVGDAVNYTIGRLFGEKLFSNPNSKIFRRSYLDKTHAFMNVTAAKPLSCALCADCRTFAPFVAGMGHMSYRHFAMYNVVGALLWVLLFTYAGYLFGDLPVVQENLKLLIVAIIVLSVLPGVIELFATSGRRRNRRNKVRCGSTTFLSHVSGCYVLMCNIHGL